MFRNVNLQTRLISAFLLMGFLVLVVALIGLSGVKTLSQHVDTLSNTSLPSVLGLWKINEGQTQIESSERLLQIPTIDRESRQEALARIDRAWEQIETGFEQYESTSFTEDEERLYQQFQQEWATWRRDHEAFLRLEAEFTQLEIRNPWARLAELRSQPNPNPSQLAAVQAALALRQQMFEGRQNREESFETATSSILGLIKINEEVAKQADDTADRAVVQITALEVASSILGPLTAIILGVMLSWAIAKPLDRALRGIINQVVSSSTEIAAAVRQQESIAAQQASFVNQTTAAIDELGASSRLSTEQAESAATGADRALSQADRGAQVVESTLQEMQALNLKIANLGEQIMRLSEQSNQIGSISALVGELANQTNMLALNAAVEAVRAGEAGKGFGVVASEIRRLADESKQSAQNINALVNQIQTAVNSTVAIKDEATQTIDNALEHVEHLATAFSEAAEAVQQVVVNSQQISLSAKQQEVAMQQVVEAMNNINIGAKQTATGLSQTKLGTQQLNEASLRLKSLV